MKTSKRKKNMKYHHQLLKSVVGLVIFGISVTAITLFPLKAQEELSPAEQETPAENAPPSGDADASTGAKESDSAEDAFTGSLKPVLWKNDQSGQLYANSSVKFILDSRDNLSQTDYVEYKINDNKFVRYIEPITITEEGPHSITYRAIDRAGNREFNRNFNVVIDNSAPQVAFTPAKAFVERDGRLFTSLGNTFTIRAVDQYSGIKDIKYGINSPPEQTYEEGRTVQLSNSGSQIIQYNARDHLGNNTDGGNIVVQVDDKKPAIRIKSSVSLRKIDGTNYARRATAFSIVANDEGSGVAVIMVKIDGSEEWQTYNKPLYFATEQEHSIEAKASDAVGNESETVVSRFIVDDNPPISKLRTSVSETNDANAPQKEGEEQ